MEKEFRKASILSIRPTYGYVSNTLLKLKRKFPKFYNVIEEMTKTKNSVIEKLNNNYSAKKEQAVNTYKEIQLRHKTLASIYQFYYFVKTRSKHLCWPY